VYLFGGTSAGFGHYVKWDLLREGGDTRYQPDRFDYDFTNIYRSTQDLDLVVDGPSDKAQTLARLLSERFPSFQGSKDQWEVRLLRQTSGDKEALLQNPDFLNQHTDSNSTGLIEVTESNDPTVRDLRDWEARTPQFLRDLAEGKIHFYFSKKHEKTSRFVKGLNPPILSVVRAFTKAFQYELQVRDEDRAVMQKIIDAVEPGELASNPYVKNWLEKNATKLVRHAVNIEFAWNTIDKNKLRKKMIAVSGDKNHVDSMAWWLNREPLRSYKIGTGSGKTAKELKLDVVAHEANNFLAYESITRAHTGEPNALVSRGDARGEAAVHGDGFYTRKGRIGARNTGWTVRFHLNPDARQGSDFLLIDDYIVVRNKRALIVIPEDLKFTLIDYFSLIGKLDFSDRGILEKAKRRFTNLSARITREDALMVKAMFEDQKNSGLNVEPILAEWTALPASREFADITFELLKNSLHSKKVLSTYVSNLAVAQHIEIYTLAIDQKTLSPTDFLEALRGNTTLLKRTEATTWIHDLIRSKDEASEVLKGLHSSIWSPTDENHPLVIET
ncbi:MAG: hypothetical protein AAB250_10825, partial [Bdellovibrionota bacterium]